jgi:hypothetical protein
MSTETHATFMDPPAAAKVLLAAIAHPEKPLTLADAAAQSGLALRDAERGLHELVREYRGQLRVTDKGELLFVFPTRFTQPWKTRDALSSFFARIGRGIVGVGRFVVRAWLTIALLGYVAIFLAVAIGLMFASANSNNNNRSRGGALPGELIYVVLRVLGDALFWTFHPFSPISVRPYGSYGWQGERARARSKPSEKNATPFYEKVNRYVFGPPPPVVDAHAMEKTIVAAIRAGKGRIGLGDVMRVTGLPREEADPLMAKLMLDFDGDVVVSDEGGITYRFPSLRVTADANGAEPRAPEPAWTHSPALPPLTGNEGGANVLVTLLNGFNLLMAIWALDANLTLSKVMAMMQGIPLIKLPYDGVPIALGVVPLVMSILLFALPIGRALLRPRREKKIARERGRLAVLREVITQTTRKEPVDEERVARAWSDATGEKPNDKAIVHEVVRLGGDVDADAQGRVRYRFVDLETESAALEEERAAAEEEEKKAGRVVFASDS